jgi:hypothetical protein
MATREQYERRLLATIASANEVVQYCADGVTLSEWSPKLACENLARELAAILAERDASPPSHGAGEHQDPEMDRLNGIRELELFLRDTIGGEPRRGVVCGSVRLEPSTGELTFLSAPTAPETAGEVMTSLRHVMTYENYRTPSGETGMRAGDGPWIRREAAMIAARADQRAAAESVAGPLRAQIAELEAVLRRVAGALLRDGQDASLKVDSLRGLCRGIAAGIEVSIAEATRRAETQGGKDGK